MSLQNAYYLFIIVIFITACKRDDIVIEDDQKSIVITSNPFLDTEGGVTLLGEIRKMDSYTSCGFLLSSDTMKIDSSFHVVFEVPVPTSGKLSKEIFTGLEPNYTYYYKAFVKKDSTIYVGETKAFTYTKDKPIVFTKLSPGPYHLGDTILIYGKNFDPQRSMIDVVINDYGHFTSSMPLKPMSSDTVLYYRIPHNITYSNFQVKISDYRRYINPITVTLATPQITDISSTSLSYGDTITINGEHFEREANYASVFFDRLKGNVVAASRNQLKVVVPKIEIKSNITVIAQNQKATSASQYEIAPVKINTNSFAISYGDEFYIYGNNLHLIERNSATLNGMICWSQEITEKYAKFKVPFAYFPNRKTDFKFRTISYQWNTVKDVTIKDKWYLSGDFPVLFSQYHNVFKHNGEVYVLGDYYQNYQYVRKLHKFTQSNYSWTDIAIPNNIIAATSVNNKILLANNTGDLLRLDGTTATKISKIPIQHGLSVMFLGHNGKLYLFLDYTYSNTPLHFFIYDEQTNIWIKKSTPDTYLANMANLFVLNNQLYVSDHYGKIWKYNEQTDLWEYKITIPVAHKSPRFAIFTYNNKAYIAVSSTPNSSTFSENVYVYYPQSNHLEDKGYTLLTDRGSYVGFELNGQFYFGGDPYNAGNSDLIQTEAF